MTAPSATFSGRQPIVALTSLRGIAAWLVVLFHFSEALPAGLPSGVYRVVVHGYLAVDLFFQLSGFVIALNYATDFRTVSLAGVRRFLLLRLARIYPLHGFMLLLFLLNPIAILLLSQQGDPGLRYEPTYWLLSVLLVQNWGFTQGLAWNAPAWSISTELAAYLLFPWAALALQRTLRRPWAMLAALALVLAGLAGATDLAGLAYLGEHVSRFGLARCLFGFVVGMLLWQLRTRWPVPRPQEGNLAALGAGACLLAYVILPLPDYAVVPLGFALLIWSLTDRSSLGARLLAVRPLEALGLISYSTYLCHYFVKDWVNFILVRPEVPSGAPLAAYLGITLLASVLLYRWIEVPGRRAGRALMGRGGRVRAPLPGLSAADRGGIFR